MMKKKETILYILNELGNAPGRTYIQKLVFLIEQKLELKLFEYVSYHYGPFSKELNTAITEMVDNKIIDEKSLHGKEHDFYNYTLTETGKKEASKVTYSPKDVDIKQKIRELCQHFQNFTPTQILKFVYREYPGWKKLSKFKE